MVVKWQTTADVGGVGGQVGVGEYEGK